MRSVALLSLAKSYSAIEQWRWISSHAFCGMMPRRAWARASAASMSRYLWMRFSSAKMRRIGSVENMSRKIPELTPTAVILQPFGGSRHDRASSLQNGRAAVHLWADVERNSPTMSEVVPGRREAASLASIDRGAGGYGLRARVLRARP